MHPKLKTHQKGERDSSVDAGSVIVVDDIYENDIPFVSRHKGLLTIGQLLIILYVLKQKEYRFHKYHLQQ